MAAAASIANLLNPNQSSATTTTLQDLNTAIPGFTGLSGQASSVIGDLLNGTPSPSTTRQAAATFGNQNGLGTGSGIVNNYGYNLYNKLGQTNQQQGISNLLSMLGGYAGTVTPTAGQQLQSSNTLAGLGEQGREADQSNAVAQFNSMVNALGLGANIVGQGNQQIPQLHF